MPDEMFHITAGLISRVRLAESSSRWLLLTRLQSFTDLRRSEPLNPGVPQVAYPVEERRRDEHDGEGEERRQAEVELQVVPHLLQSALRQQGGAVTFFGLADRVGGHRAVLGIFVLPGRLAGEKRR